MTLRGTSLRLGLLALVPAGLLGAGCGADAPAVTPASTTGDGDSDVADATSTATTTHEADSGTSASSSSETTAHDSSDSSSSDSGAPGGCGAGSECGPAAPAGWIGPMVIARVDDGREPACPEGYELGPLAFEGFVDPGPALCSCTCTLAERNCYAYSYVHDDALCTVGPVVVELDETCVALTLDGSAVVHSEPGLPATCTSESTEVLPPVPWSSRIVSCELAEPAACDDGVCRPSPPDPFDAGACVYQQGDVGCPAGAFNTKHLFHEGVVDTRSCGECSCGDPAPSCIGDMLLYDLPNCVGAPSAAIPSTLTCEPGTAASAVMQYEDDDSCPVAAQPPAQGELEPSGARTFCCER